MRTRRSKAGTVTPFANPERQFRARREVSPAPIHNIYTFYESESSESDTENVDIESLTLEQYLALDENNTRRRFTCPDDSTFEIKGQLLREIHALKSIQKLVKHLHKWHCEESYTTTLDPLRIITEKLKLLYHEIEELTVDFRKLNTDDVRRSYYAEVKSIKSSKINYDRTYTESSNRPTNLKDKFEQCRKESSERQAIQNERIKKIMISTDLSLKNHDSSIKRLEQKVNHLARLISTHNPKHTLTPKTETFGEKVKRHILEENKKPTVTHDKPKQQLQKVVSHEIKESPTHYSVTRQNRLPPKETDPGSFILPCIIGNHFMSNALADLGESISIMPYSLFKRLGLGSLKPIKMTIKMADRSMQSPKGIKENALVKISNFVFLIDFVILDIMEDENVSIILGRPMLATAHAKIDIYGKKISLGVGNDQVVFNINKKESPAFISPICVINKVDKTQELVMNEEKVKDFENYLSPEYESQDIISLSPSELAENKEEFSMTLYDPDKRISIRLEEFVDIDDVWDDLDLGIMSNKKATTEFLKSGDKIHLHSLDNLQLSCKIGDEDKKRGIHKPEKKIKGFYRGCLSLGNEYTYDQEVVDWIQGCIDDGMIIQKLGGNYRDRLDSYSFGNFAEIAAGIKSLLEDGDIDFRLISNFKAIPREFLVLLEGKQKSSGGIFDNIKYLILFGGKIPPKIPANVSLTLENEIFSVICSISINRGLIQAIPTSLPPQPIGQATKASNLQRIPLGVQGRSHFT
ncbi:homeodomain-like protein [Tanacetum coccineum]